MEKLKVGVVFGGKSSEHNVSKVSGTSVISNLNKEKYDILPIYIDETGNWYIYEKNINEIKVLDIDSNIKNDLKPLFVDGLISGDYIGKKVTLDIVDGKPSLKINSRKKKEA